MPKTLIAIGIILVITGLFWPWIKKLGFGQLPGDIVIRKGNFVFYFPITTCIIISLIVMIIWWLLNR
ncbi:hypothetical protein A8135_12115 [Legionella jamestowniensis]|uniref:DUF2905 domain-containing protein n=1 Tax=Legionella jamestowniensis TaxID=455 RepID=A0ABX2XZC5_9GAMM|nr:DUF2905 domain-containing protein [Legionella jamestowniensis]OCH98296.1 hypothetical protein A8135_12115 [Legionella jamestowniensis]